LGLSVGTLLSVALVYTFRVQWGAFPTSIFILSFFINLILIFKLNRYILKFLKKVRKNAVVIGEGQVVDIIGKRTVIKRIKVDEIEQLVKRSDIDEIVICERIQREKDLNLLIFLIKKLKCEIVFSPSVYVKLLPERINGENSLHFLNTFIGRKRDIEEFFMRSLDVLGSLFILFISAPISILSALLIKSTSSGPVLYKQERVGKDGKIFTLYKFRTMVKDAEKKVGPILASRDDPRITKVGKLLRTTRLDELPQLFNVLRGDMSLVGPRPERPHFVKLHKSLRELRLTVRPGITGLAQIRSFYDLKPKHKIKYDYLYIQQRSLLLNLYTLLKTIPVIFSKKGW
jgi:lipopolysaccharide/colanic/teichoic acid biosynthesis glycosyltransferase